MIHYELRCHEQHAFDGWFKDSDGFESQVARGLVSCPECGSTRVSRALMAPALAKRRAAVPAPQAPEGAPTPATPPAAPKAATGPMPAQVLAALQRMRAEVEKNCDYVGPRFAEEARRIHNGESQQRGIYGESTPEQAEALAADGIEVSQIPWVPRADG